MVTREEFEGFAAAGYTRVPVVREVLSDLDTPLSVYLKLADGPYTYLFESVEGGERFGRYSIIGLPARRVYEFRGHELSVREHGEVVEEGLVADVFANPRAEATKNLVYPEMADSSVLSDVHGQKVRIIFNGAPAAREPLIAKMAMEAGIAASILGASTRSVGDKAYGYILLEIPGGPDELAKAVNFLRATPVVSVQVEVDYAAKEGK